MRIKYIGKADSITADWNGKRYCFRKKDPVQDIPSGLYDNIKSANIVLRDSIVPIEYAIEVSKASIIEKVNEPVEVKRGPGRPKKVR
mgnify:CR=1 FL=1